MLMFLTVIIIYLGFAQKNLLREDVIKLQESLLVHNHMDDQAKTGRKKASEQLLSAR